MIFHFVFVALATVTGAQLHLAQLAKGTCSLVNLVNTWQQNGIWEISMQYSISGKDEIIPISNDCEARIESALSYCKLFICILYLKVTNRSKAGIIRLLHVLGLGCQFKTEN
jgi:hypothetical protein